MNRPPIPPDLAPHRTIADSARLPRTTNTAWIVSKITPSCVRNVGWSRAHAVLAGAVITLGTVLSACRPSPASLPPDAIAQVGDRVITTAEFTEEIHRRGVSARNEEEASARRREILDAMVEEESLVQSARAAGFDRDPEIQRRIRRWMAQEYRERMLGGTNAAALSDDDLHPWYAAHSQEFTEPPQVRGMLMGIRFPRKATDEIKNAARAKLTHARESMETSANPDLAFSELARTISEDPSTRRQGGDTGWIVAGRLTRWPDEVTQALFSLSEESKISPMIETGDGVYLVRFKERKPERVRPFAEVRARVEFRVTAARKQSRERDVLSKARASVTYRDNPAALAAVRIPQSTTLTQVPPSLPGTETPRLSQP